MPIYEFECEDGHRLEQFHTMAARPDYVSCPCGLDARRLISRVNIHAFKPYVETNFTGKPILIESARQRDELCKQHHVTYDEVQFVRKPKVPSAVESINFGDVKKAWNEGVLPDGTPLDRSPIRPEDPIE